MTMAKKVIVEVCVDSVASARAAERGGAQRVELCGDLLEGGITPSLGLIAVVRSRISIGLHLIIRPRPGDFCYSDEEFESMQRDIEFAKAQGADGVALGILHPDGTVDIPRTRSLVQRARPMAVTFHRAFDMSPDLLRALEDVCATGADRILTSGGEQQCVKGIPPISQLVKSARGRTIIMAAGGIRIHNVAAIVHETAVSEIHVGLAVPVSSSVPRQTSRRLSVGKVDKHEFQRTQVREEDVRDLIRAISAGTA